ncbi:MAG: Response regulator of zinc sigma-54-dependent two-component system, partial [Myxococcaceae bacterium]|nr:Response regulator of zinc sigma-54-dependent two-component system [Myxococcaceae bacterium]
MSPTRTIVPWPELAALGALFVAVAAWSGAGRPIDPRGLSVAGLAVLIALAPKRLARSGHGAQAEAIAVAAALGALSVASVVAGFSPGSRALRIAHALASGELLGLSTVLAFAQPMRTASLRRAALPGVFVAVVGTVGLWPGAEHWFAGSRALAPAAAGIAALLHLAAVQRPTAPVERARWIYPTLGVAALALATLARSLSGVGDGALFAWALGVAAHVLGLVVGHADASAAHAAAFARRTLAGALGFLAGAVALVFGPGAPLTAMAVGLGVGVFVLPMVDRWLRPADGRLLDACARIGRGLARAEGLDELAAAVLDPLREAARNLRAPAAFWVLEGARVLHVDVAGTPSVRPLSVDAEKVLVTWLRTRPSVVFADTLRPHLVRRPELRSVVDALDGYEAFAAMPLCDAEELVGVVVIPRGDRAAPASFEEERALEDLRCHLEGALLRILAA